MSLVLILALLGTGVLAGLASSVASVASLISYPVLLASGLPPVSANMTNTVALVLTGAGSVAGSRRELEGQGCLVLRLLTAMLNQPLPRVNAVKNAVSGLANGTAAVVFAIFGPVRWEAVPPLAAGFLVGGWLGPAVVRRVNAQALRVVIGICGLAVAIRLGVAAYR